MKGHSMENPQNYYNNVPKSNLYLLTLLDSKLGQPDMAFEILKTFITAGFECNKSVFMFESEWDIDAIHKNIKANSTQEFLYLLLDITDSIDSKKFKAYFNNMLGCAEEMNLRLDRYRKIAPKKGLIITDEQFNQLLDKISNTGLDSLSQDEKRDLDEYSQKKNK